MRVPGDIRSVDLRATWPLVGLLVLYPLWWALGLGVFIFIIAAIPMGYRLIVTRGVRVPPGFVIWLVFLLWNTLALVNLRLNPVGTVAGDFSARLVPASLRMLEYAAVTVMLLYAGNVSRRSLPQLALARLLGLGFVWSVLGGLVAVASPRFQFNSVFELLLPASVRSNEYVQSLVHPSAAQLHEILGFESPRPAAPWGYTNTWGYNIAVCGVWFAVGFMLSRRVGSRLWTGALLLAALVPVIYSLNRGLWLAIVMIGVYVAVRLAMLGRVWMITAVGGVAAVAVVLIAITPLQDYVTGRLDNPKSNDIRSFSIQGAIRITQESPFLGYGSTRNALGSDQSITVGRSVTCPRCGNVPLGSNGQIWLLMVTSGFVGLFLYFAFFLFLIVRYWRDTSPIGLAGVLVLLLSVFFAFVYNAMVTPLAFTMLSVALLWRNERGPRRPVRRPGRPRPRRLPGRRPSVDLTPDSDRELVGGST